MVKVRFLLALVHLGRLVSLTGVGYSQKLPMI